MNTNSGKQAIVLFDGVCNFCNASVRFIARHDSGKNFTFVPFHSDEAKALLKNFGQPTGYFESLVLITNGKIYFRSSAALHIARKSDWKIRWMYLFILVPKPLRDKVYDWVASHRYSWFGKEESCEIPDKTS